ncbi:MAG: hypothetical protein AAF919_03075 [Pseudomonadota bacterium]
MFRKTALILALLTAPAMAQVGSIAVDDDFVRGSTGWQNTPGTFELAWKPASGPGGAVMICGVWAIDNDAVIKGAHDILGEARVVINDIVVLENLLFFSRAGTRAAIDSTPANCMPTAAPTPVRNARILFGDGTFRAKRR